ncbi:hypothetical protein ACHAWF_008249 [Thalassiosira exigua]
MPRGWYCRCRNSLSLFFTSSSCRCVSSSGSSSLFAASRINFLRRGRAVSPRSQSDEAQSDHLEIVTQPDRAPTADPEAGRRRPQPVTTTTTMATATAPEGAMAKKTPPISPINSRSGRSKVDFPPPFPEPIYGYHQNDVLSGRGATVNAHPGNRRFRDLCAARKSEFEAATNFQKRKIALEIVEGVMGWDPPGRFLERATDGAEAEEDADAFFRRVDVNEVLVGSSARYFFQMGHSLKKTKRLKRALGPWKDMGIGRAIQKACGVIRDYKRPDRIALRANGLLKKPQFQGYEDGDFLKDGTSHPSHTFQDELLSTELHHGGINEMTIAPDECIAGTPQYDDVSATYEEIVPTSNDVLLGRGAFINEHTGNRRFRTLALERKPQFEVSTPNERRTLSLEMIELTKALDPPGRFLKRAPYALQEPVRLSDGKYMLPPRGLEGPWEAVSEDKARQKAIQVLRDVKIEYPNANGLVPETDQVTAWASVEAPTTYCADAGDGEMGESAYVYMPGRIDEKSDPAEKLVGDDIHGHSLQVNAGDM